MCSADRFAQVTYSVNRMLIEGKIGIVAKMFNYSYQRANPLKAIVRGKTNYLFSKAHKNHFTIRKESSVSQRYSFISYDNLQSQHYNRHRHFVCIDLLFSEIFARNIIFYCSFVFTCTIMHVCNTFVTFYDNRRNIFICKGEYHICKAFFLFGINKRTNVILF